MADAADPPSTPALLDALRASGAADRDPVRFAYLEALTRRAASQPEAIRRLLAARINAAATALADQPPAPPEEAAPAGGASPLAELLAYISQQAHAAPGHMPASPDTTPAGTPSRQASKKPATRRAPPAPELKSVAYFRDEWSKLSTEQQLTQTLAQAPPNAGPMNSQHLVLRSLERMRDIAPDYLQGFMSYIDTLIWLEQADPTKPAGGEGQGRTRSAKRGSANR